jgi:hypothetical protein
MVGVPRIPILADYLDLIRRVDFFDGLLRATFLVALILMVLITFRSIFPYGKTYTRGTAVLKLEVTDRLAFMIATISPLLLFVYGQLYFPNGNLLNIGSLCYIAHFIHRSLIYPWFRSSFSKKWPLESLIYYTVSNIVSSTIAFHGIIFGPSSIHIAFQLLAALGFVGCAVVAGIHDYKLCALRKSGDTGYQVPHGLLFQWISGPHYLFELLQWCCFLPFLEYGFGMATFGMQCMVNLTGRAESVHDAYTKRLFKNKYPEDRTSYIPFIKNTRLLI